MEDELIISTSFPFKGCVNCPNLKSETDQMYADGKLAVIIISCANKDICQNAYDVWKGEEK